MNHNLMQRRWRGQSGKVEVWYTTITEPESGTGVWLHHEMVAPTGNKPPFVHGFIGIFVPGEAPRILRFGPAPVTTTNVFGCEGVEVGPTKLVGLAGDVRWDLDCEPTGAPMYTFPAWAWRTGMLPAAHVVPIPSAVFTGTIKLPNMELSFADAHGATGHIFGSGMAQRWAWLHADLGDGDVLEIVAAQARHAPWKHLPVLPLVQLRLGGEDWPSRDQLLMARLFRADIGLPNWTVAGQVGHRRLQVSVQLPSDRVLQAPFTDPDGSKGICHNSELADAQITLLNRVGGSWQVEREWSLAASAHAEVGMR